MARRKSFKLGGARLNLSKSGIGVSTGVKGFRVSSGPRGTRLTTRNPITGTRHSTSLSPSTRNRRQAERIQETVADPRAGLIAHRHIVRLETKYLNHEKEVTNIVRTMGKKHWELEMRSTPTTGGKETVSTLTFVQYTKKKKAPKAPVKGSVSKKGGLLARMFS